MVTSISSAVRIGADAPPGTTAFSRPVPLDAAGALDELAQRDRHRRLVHARAASRGRRPSTCRVPPCVLVPRPGEPRGAAVDDVRHAAQIVSTLLTIVGAPNAPLIAGNGGLIFGQPFLPSSDEMSPVSSPQM